MSGVRSPCVRGKVTMCQGWVTMCVSFPSFGRSAATSEETVVAAPPPSEAQIREIDSDVFCSGSFSSSREKKQEV